MKLKFSTSLKSTLVGLSFIASTMAAAQTAVPNTYYTKFTPVNYTKGTFTDTFTQLLGINYDNVIAGYHGAAPNKGFTLKLKNGQPIFTDENFPGSDQTQVVAINNAGVTGGFYVAKDAHGNSVTHGFIRGAGKDGQFVTLDKKDTQFNQILGLNDYGYAAGYSSVEPAGEHEQRAFIYHEGKFNDLTNKLPTKVTLLNSQATGINNSKWISGFYETASGIFSGFLLHGKDFYKLDFPGASSTQALGINSYGVVVGAYVGSDNNLHGFAYYNGSYIGPIDAGFGPNTTVNGINDNNTIVGFTDNNGVDVGFVSKFHQHQ